VRSFNGDLRNRATKSGAHAAPSDQQESIDNAQLNA